MVRWRKCQVTHESYPLIQSELRSFAVRLEALGLPIGKGGIYATDVSQRCELKKGTQPESGEVDVKRFCD